VRLVIADTSPINYFLLIGNIDVLPKLFEKVIVPEIVRDELAHPKAPAVVRNWIASPPDWVEIRNAKVEIHDPALESLDAGEEAAITLAIEVHADLLLMDDEEGVAVARGKGLEVTGTLGILVRGAQRRLLVLRDAVDRLKQTNFRFRQDILDPYLTQQGDNN
jgi:predicted nucleic acid-binding protein